jgi:chitinase
VSLAICRGVENRANVPSFVQFYNTPSCSARAGLDHTYGAYGGPATDISYDTWVDHVKSKSANPAAKIYLGLPAATAATFGSMYLSPDEAQQLIEKFQCKYPEMFGGVMLWEATFSEGNQIDGMSYGKHMKKGMENCSCASNPTSTPSTVSSTTVASASATASASEVPSSSIYADKPTSSASYGTTYNGVTASVTSSASSTASYGNMTTSSATSASTSASPSGCGVKGFDKTPAFNFLNDTASANFNACSARCNANSACVSFAFGYTQCLLYAQTV